MPGPVIQALASLALLLGVGLLYLAWRGRGGGRRFRGGLLLGWSFIGVGILAWGGSMSPGVGVSIGVVAAMCPALAIVAAHSLSLAPARRTQGRVRAEPDGLELGPGYWRRFAIRLGSSLLLAPGLGVLAGLCWFAHGPGGEAGRLIGMGFVAVTVAAAALVAQLMTPQPGRMAGMLALASAVATAAVFLPLALRGQP